jgi:hypothetical protein
MPYTLDELIRPLGPRFETVRPFTVLSPLSGQQMTTGSFVRKHGLVMLAGGLLVAVATMWSMQSGYLALTPQPHIMQGSHANSTPNACTDPTRGQLPAMATSLRELQENLIPEIRAGYPPQMSKPEIIRLPPDMSSVTVTPAPRPQSAPAAASASKPAAKNKTIPKDVRS